MNLTNCLLAKPHLHHDGYSWRYGPTHPSEEWVRKYSKQHGLIPSSLRRTTSSKVAIVKKRPTSKILLERLKEVVRQHLEEGEDFGVEVSAGYSSWRESNISDLTEEKEEKAIEFSLDFKFISYT